MRIIPTRVGTSDGSSTVSKAVRDHPHACGDKLVIGCETKNGVGSSPRVWGQGRSHFSHPFSRRIIPTRVGTSFGRYISCRKRRDHPHACGDKQAINAKACMPQGSSPRVWGQGFYRIASLMKDRIIPTRVGTSFFYDDYTLTSWDHPHACGDK